MSKFRFVNKGDDMLYNPKRELTTYYQICGFSCGKGFHTIRKVTIDELGSIVNVQEKNYKEKKVKDFVQKCPVNKYAVHPTHDISVIDLPQPEQILASKSSLLNDNNMHSGFAGY